MLCHGWILTTSYYEKQTVTKGHKLYGSTYIETSRIGKAIETESRIVVTRENGEWPIWGDIKFLESGGMAAQSCDLC